MADFKEAMMKFMKIQNERLEEQWRLDKERFEKQNEKLEKMFDLWKIEQGNAIFFFLQDSIINSNGKFKHSSEEW